MNHYATADFWFYYRQLTPDIQKLADKAYAILQFNPRHPSLHFKKVGDFWSARVNLNYRALAIDTHDGFIWIWIGDHAAYERMI